MAIYTYRSGGYHSIYPFQRDCSTSPPNVRVFAPTSAPLVTILLEPVLWKCSYGPGDHFMFSVNNGI